jgi:hypothetical protein
MDVVSKAQCIQYLKLYHIHNIVSSRQKEDKQSIVQLIYRNPGTLSMERERPFEWKTDH